MAKCPMFPIFVSRSILRIYQVSYCEGDFGECHRYQRAVAGEMPPAEMLPDGTTLR